LFEAKNAMRQESRRKNVTEIPSLPGRWGHFDVFFYCDSRCFMSNLVDDRNPEEKKKEFCTPKMSKE